MKIVSYIYKGNMIKITTDDEDTPDFVYFKDQFNDLDELKTEIEAKIAEKKDRKENKEAKVTKVQADLDKEVGGE